jgi:hypothetical protein
MASRARWGAAVCALLIAACAPNNRPAANVPRTTPVTPAPRGTLPPTWTPTPSRTPAPPTDTPTPQPSPSMTPPLSAADLCKSLWLASNLHDGSIFAWEHVITLLVSIPSPDVKVRIAFKNHQTGEGRGIDLNGGQGGGWQVKIRDLPGVGQYDWRISLQTEQYGEICVQTGFFIATSQESTRAEESSIR